MGKVNSIGQFLASKRGQILFNILYSLGASVVIIGAMFKIIHLPFADYVLMAGMITEAFVFAIAAFDVTTIGAANSTEVANTGGLLIGSEISGSSANVSNAVSDKSSSANAKAGGASGSVVIVSGGGGSGSYGTGGSNASSSGENAPSEGISGGGTSISFGTNMGGGSNRSGSGYAATTNGANNENEGVVSGNSILNQERPTRIRPENPEYSESLSYTAQNLEDFSTTVQSLNEVSKEMLDAYKHVTEGQGFVENLTTLNQNVSELNEVFNTQLQTITEQMSAIRYINDSLIRMKNLYDGAIGDSYMFREESAKMTKHIEALNNVYARLLQAMTLNNNNNNSMNPNNF